jgi:O-antigen/teichoic acid export membrane protein
MSVSAAGAVASGLLSIIATKIVAVLMGPASLALLATLQQLRQTAVTAATCNGQTALVQGASALEGAACREYLRTVGTIFALATAGTTAALALAPAAIARWAGVPATDAPLVRWLAVAVALSSLFVFLSAILNALGAIRKLATLQIAGPAAMAVLAWPVAHGLSFPAMLAISAAATVAGAFFGLAPYRGTLSRWLQGTGPWCTKRASRHFLSISMVMLVTGLVASGALVTVRGNILRRQGLGVAGQFDAAWGISMNQVTLVLASLQTYYLPALARLRTPRERGIHIARILTVAAPVAAGAIATIALTKPVLLHLLYSPAFSGAGQYLRWTLLGDYLKVASWILSIPMLAAADMRVFLASDLAASGVFLAAAALLVRWRSPAESAAIAFLMMHVVHLGICAFYACQRHAFPWRGRATAVWLAGLAVVGTASTVGWSL